MEEMSYIISWRDGPTITSTPCFYRWPGIQFSGGSQQFATPVPEDSMPSSNLHSTRHTNDKDTGIQVKHSNTQNKINKVKCLNFNFIIKSINENLYNNKSTGWSQDQTALYKFHYEAHKMAEQVKALCHQTWQTEISPMDTNDGRTELILTSCSLISMNMWKVNVITF